VNAPDDPVLEVYFIRVPNGPLTEHLVALKPGDPLQVSSRAAGLFTLSQVPDGEDLWMLSTGTALGVFLSLLRTPEPWTRFRRLVLVHAVRTREELTYAETVADLSAAHPEAFRFVPIVSRQEAAFALRGRIPAMIESGELPDHVGLPISPERSQFMLCGNPGMVADTSDTLERMGLRRNRRKEPGQITTEKYW
jgi:ferredoxin--NADP+ reductase